MSDDSILYDIPPDAKIVKERNYSLVNRVRSPVKDVADANNTLKITFTHKTRGGMPILTLQTLQELFHYLNVNVRYNVITKDVEINIPNQEFSLENSYECSMAWIESAAASCELRTSALERFTKLAADNNRYNPIQEWILSKRWDDRDRLKEMLNTIDAVDNVAKEALLFRWFISAIAAAFEPSGIDARGMIVLQGEQSMGKTWWFRKLVDNEYIRDHYLMDSFLFDPHNKDLVKQCVSKWIVELGEIDSTFKKSDIGALKAFITRSRDTLRVTWGKKEQTLPRHTVLGGSVNKKGYLVDDTGNTRFWTIACKSINSYHTIDMQQFWAQMYVLYNPGDGIKGEKWQLTKQELDLVNMINLDHTPPDFIEETIGTFYDWENGMLNEYKTASQIATEIGIKNIHRGHLAEVSKEVLRRNGGIVRRSNGMRLMKVPGRKF